MRCYFDNLSFVLSDFLFIVRSKTISYFESVIKVSLIAVILSNLQCV